MQIRQMNMSYNPEEDRLTFLINTIDKKEFRFLLTRRFVKLLFSVLDQHMETQADVQVSDSKKTISKEAKRTLKQMDHEQAIEKSDFSKAYEATSERPLGEASILAHGLNIKTSPQGLVMGIADKNKKGITLTFNQIMLHSLYQILLKAANQAQWDLSPALSDKDLLVAAASKEIH